MTLKRALPPLMLLVALSLAGCASYRDVLAPPSVTVEAVHLRQASLTQGTLVLTLRAANPNPLPLTVQRLSYTLEINQRSFSADAPIGRLRLPPQGETAFELPVVVDYLDLFDSVAQIFTTGRVTYALTGSVGVGPFDLRFATRGELELPDAPHVRLTRVEIAALSLGGADLEVTLELANPNPFAVDLRELTFDLALGGNRFAGGRVQVQDPLLPGGATTVTVALRLNFLQLGRAASRLLAAPNSGYGLTGTLEMLSPAGSALHLPFDLEGVVDLQRRGGGS